MCCELDFLFHTHVISLLLPQILICCLLLLSCFLVCLNFVCLHLLIHLQSSSLNSHLPLLPTFSLLVCLDSLTHSLPISLLPPPVCPRTLVLLFFLHPVLLRSPPPSILPAHVPSKLPTRSWTDPTDWQRCHLLYWHEVVSTLINGNGSAVKWLALEKLLVFVVVTIPLGRTRSVWMYICIIKWNIAQQKLLKVSLIHSNNTSHWLTFLQANFFFLMSPSLHLIPAWPLVQWQFWKVTHPIAPFPVFSYSLFSALCFSSRFSSSPPLLCFSWPSLWTSRWNWLAGVRWYQCGA